MPYHDPTLAQGATHLAYAAWHAVLPGLLLTVLGWPVIAALPVQHKASNVQAPWRTPPQLTEAIARHLRATSTPANQNAKGVKRER